MTRNARSTWRRRSRTAPTISSSAGRSARRPSRARPPRQSRRRLRLFLRPSEQLLEQPLEMRMDRQLHAVEQHFAIARHADRREILDLEIADLVGLILDVDPAELRAGKLFRKREKARTVLPAGVAPLGAQTRDDHGHG